MKTVITPAKECFVDFLLFFLSSAKRNGRKSRVPEKTVLSVNVPGVEKEAPANTGE